jgi:hypothetical protein
MKDEDLFLADPLLPALVRREQDDFFALGLLVHWPIVCENFCRQYETFLSAVKTECFQDEMDSFFFLPLHSLHITVASLFPATHGSDLPKKKSRKSESNMVDGEWQRDFINEWKEVLLQAFFMEDWPKKPLVLHLESARITSHAGILLWKDSTGGIEQIRHCIRTAVQWMNPHLEVHLRIPDIIHTTFVRYKDQVSLSNLTRPSQKHSCLVERVVANHSLFGSNTTINANENENNDGLSNHVQVADSVKLVNCKIYLQGTQGEKDHPVYLTLPLTGANTVVQGVDYIPCVHMPTK